MKIVIDISEEEYKCVQITGHIGNATQVSNAIFTGTPLPEMHEKSIKHLISKIRDYAKHYPQEYSDKIYDAVTIYKGIEEVNNCGIRKGLELAISIIDADAESEEEDK